MGTLREEIGKTDQSLKKGTAARALENITGFVGGYYALEKQQIFQLLYPSNSFKAAMKSVYHMIQSTPSITPNDALRKIFDAFNEVAEKNTLLPIRSSSQRPIVECLVRILEDPDTAPYASATLKSLDHRTYERLVNNISKFGKLDDAMSVSEKIRSIKNRAPTPEKNPILDSLLHESPQQNFTDKPKPTKTSVLLSDNKQRFSFAPTAPEKENISQSSLKDNIENLAHSLNLTLNDSALAKIVDASLNIDQPSMQHTLKSHIIELIQQHKDIQNPQINNDKLMDAISALDEWMPGLKDSVPIGPTKDSPNI